jgi:hypothetical protein
MDDPRRGGLVEFLRGQAELGLALFEIAGLRQLEHFANPGFQFRLGGPIPGAADQTLTKTLLGAGNIGHGFTAIVLGSKYPVSTATDETLIEHGSTKRIASHYYTCPIRENPCFIRG